MAKPESPSASDRRSRRVVVCAHCVLNQNAKLEGLARWPGMIEEAVELIRRSGAGILQMPCPEMRYEGIGRFDKSVEQYRCPAYRELAGEIAREVVGQIESYLQWGYRVPVILAMDGSPSCGIRLASSAPEWRGPVAGQNWKPPRYIREPGVFMAALEEELKRRRIAIPILGIPEGPDLGSMGEVLGALGKVLEGRVDEGGGRGA